MSHSRTAKLPLCPISKGWKLLQYKVLLDQLVVPHLLHTCQGELLNQKTLGNCSRLTLLCVFPTASLTLFTKEGVMTYKAAVVRPHMEDHPGLLLTYQKDVDKLE